MTKKEFFDLVLDLNSLNNTVWFREFEDSTYELGILETQFSNWPMMDAGDFAYGFNLNLKDWTFLGIL